MLPFGWGARPGATLVVAAWVVCGMAGIGALVGAYGYTMQFYLLADGGAHEVPLSIALAHVQSRDQQTAARVVGAGAADVCAGSGVGRNAGVCAGGGESGPATVRRGVLRGARGARGGGGKRGCASD
jgi:hypothetical protein